MLLGLGKMRVLFTEFFQRWAGCQLSSCIICLTSLKEGLPHSPWQLEGALFFQVACGNHPCSSGQQLGGILVRGHPLCGFFVPDAQVAAVRTAVFTAAPSPVFSLQAVLWVTVLGTTAGGNQPSGVSPSICGAVVA